MHDIPVILATVIFLALLFDFLNGFHDAANAIATIVVSRTLTPLQAVILAGIANFVGYFFFNVAVAKMIGKGVVNIDSITLPLLMGAVVGAIVWNILTWLWGLPTSSSHALIGGLIGSGLAASGMKVIVIGGVLKILLFIIVAPLLGMVGSMLFTLLVFILFRKSNPRNAAKTFRRLQLISATFYSVGHGTNDAQKTMGIISLALLASGHASGFEVQTWVALSCHAAIALGTMFGGWRIVRTMGTKITKIHALEGFCAETAAAIVLIGTAEAGIPVSTTHVIAGSIMGVGAVEHAANVRWGTARTILWAWLLTIPATATCGALCYWAVNLFK